MKQKKQIITLAVLLVVAAAVWYNEHTTSDASSSPAFIAENSQLLSVENPSLHWDRLTNAQKTEYKSGGRNIFSKQAPAPVTIAKVNTPPVAPYVPKGPQQEPPPPPPPPLVFPPNLKFFGYGTIPNGTSRRAFFSDGDEVYIVAEGETLLGRYRILKVNNNNLEFEEIASGRRSTTPLVEEPVAAAAAGGPT